MAKIAKCYHDNKGKSHQSADEAVASDIADILGRIGDNEGLGLGVAKNIIEHREAIEKAFADLDEMESQQASFMS
jgi:hypothetical protein